PPAQRAGISLPEGIPAAADIVNLRYKSCSEMEGQDHLIIVGITNFVKLNKIVSDLKGIK
ncbi:hypothetical protein, partial [Enterobacter cloacae]|uniref:hypothetical protein n=1 Tax=Enterobacter cloacae TaxID=550 RepID=UPI0031DEED17